MDWGEILAWIDESQTVAGIVSTVIGSIIILIVTTGVVAIVRGRRPSTGWIKQLAQWGWAHRPTTMARLHEAVREATAKSDAETTQTRASTADRGGTSTDMQDSVTLIAATASSLRNEDFAPGHGLDDLETRVRASDQCHVVKYRNGLEIGIITPTRGRFMASHLRKGRVGPFDSLEGAVRALWELD